MQNARAQRENPPPPFIISAELKEVDKLGDLTKKIEKTLQKNQEIKEKISVLEDSLKAISNEHQELFVSITSKQGDKGAHFGIRAISCYLNDKRIVSLKDLFVLDKEPLFPIFHGPIPAGLYRFKLQMTVGLLRAGGWPFLFPEGRINLEKEVELLIKDDFDSKEMNFILSSHEDAPLLSLDTKG